MRFKKQALAWAMTSVFAFSMVLTGCGSNNNKTSATETKETASQPASTTAAATETATEPEPAKLAPVELNWYLPAAPQKDTKLVEKALNDYLKDKINATVHLNFVDWGSWKDKFPVLLASGSNVDIMFTAGWSQFPQSVAKGYFADITDMLPKYAPKTVENLPKVLFEGARVAGKIYAIPTSKEIAHTNGFGYSTELAKKYGLEEQLKAFQTKIPTLEDLEPILAAVKAQDPNVSPLGGVYNMNFAMTFLDFDPVGDQNIPGMLYKNKDTIVVDEYETPEYKAIFNTMHKYYKAGYIRKDATIVKDATADRKGKKVFLIGGTTKPLANEEIGASYGYELEQFSITTPFITSNDTQGSMNAVVASSKNPERALMFLELVNMDPIVNNILNYGVEGTHFVKTDVDNVIDFAPGLTGQNSGYFPNAFWEFGNQFLNHFLVGQNTKKWDLFKEYNDSGVPSKILGFNFDAEPVKTEIAAVANVRDELLPSIATGTVDPEIFLPKFITRMKQAGLDKIIAEKQKQIDAWLATK
ncbi:extracellular solute-binding protein [Cohnella endophytica]|uniref:Extracellular solute-binding protein n=1 Tax=Cohnella endophytica TaxID=2419778 RepID=A0A494Y374_9BACL|nr:ABC transporter substrate-binding protein [Cohnella endophytica]RKP54356.1 extracellular solute-binding protein [Cohnella endophytica]